MATFAEIKHIDHAMHAIEDAIAGLRTVKAALGMTEESQIEKDLKTALRKLDLIEESK